MSFIACRVSQNVVRNVRSQSRAVSMVCSTGRLTRRQNSRACVSNCSRVRFPQSGLERTTTQSSHAAGRWWCSGVSGESGMVTWLIASFARHRQGRRHGDARVNAALQVARYRRLTRLAFDRRADNRLARLAFIDGTAAHRPRVVR